MEIEEKTGHDRCHPAINNTHPHKQTQRARAGSEDTSALAELTLRLELNGIKIKDATRSIGTLWDPVEDDRIHPSGSDPAKTKYHKKVEN